MTQIDFASDASPDIEYIHVDAPANSGVTLVDDGQFVLSDSENETSAFVVSDTAVDLNEWC